MAVLTLAGDVFGFEHDDKPNDGDALSLPIEDAKWFHDWAGAELCVFRRNEMPHNVTIDTM